MSATPELVATCWTTAGNASPLGPLESPLDLHDRIAAAAAAGFRGFGILGADLERYLRTSRLPELRAVLDDHGMTTVEVELLEDWWVPEGPRQAESQRSRGLLLRAAEALGARDVKLVPSTTERGFDLDRCASAFHDVSEEFAGVGTVVALEFLPFGGIATLAEAVELVRVAGHPNGGLLVDLWHLMRGPAGQLAALADVPVELVKAVELDDGDTEPVGTLFEDTVHRRRLPGEGDWPVPEFIRTLEAIGYAGPWGVEIISDDHRVRPIAESLPDVAAATLGQFELARSRPE
jgi:sugar phosphate isomerase/epimerase